MRDFNALTLVLAVALLVQPDFISGLKCYVCKITSIANDCISDWSTYGTTCEGSYCTIYRREIRDPEGTVTAFNRSCESKPIYLNTDIETPYHKTYYRACQTEFCNGGDGIKNVSAVKNDIADTDIIMVPGTGSHATTIFSRTRAFIYIAFAFISIKYYE